MRVEFSKRAQRSIERIDARWRENADYPDLFRTEMDELIEHLESVSNPGTPCMSRRRSGLKRMLLEKTKCHVYFVLNETRRRIEVLEVWDGRRERTPKL